MKADWKLKTRGLYIAETADGRMFQDFVQHEYKSSKKEYTCSWKPNAACIKLNNIILIVSLIVLVYYLI